MNPRPPAPHVLAPPLVEPTALPVAYKPPAGLLRLSPAVLGSLQNSVNLLRLLHARNRNQHRRSQATLYRPFRLLLRELWQLVYEDLAPEAKSIAIKRAVKRRVTFWVHAGLVERWIAAFGGMTRRESAQFAGIGMTGLGVLGQTMKELGVTDYVSIVAETREHAETVQALQRFEREENQSLDIRGHDRPVIHSLGGSHNSARAAQEDLGEVVSRSSSSSSGKDEA